MYDTPWSLSVSLQFLLPTCRLSPSKYNVLFSRGRSGDRSFDTIVTLHNIFILLYPRSLISSLFGALTRLSLVLKEWKGLNVARAQDWEG